MKDYEEKVEKVIERLNRCRAVKNISQAEMARGVGICDVQMSRILNRISTPSRQTYYKIIIYLEENEG